MTDFRALCAELCATLEAKVVVKSLPLTYQECGPLLCRARAALAEPPSLKEQALALVNSNKPYLDDTAMDTIRRALEALND